MTEYITVFDMVKMIISGFCTGLGSGIANYYVFKILLSKFEKKVK